MESFSDGVKKIGAFCFPCWIKLDDGESRHKPKGRGLPQITPDPYAATDAFRQGEKYLFGLYDFDAHPVDEPLQVALDRFEASRDYGSPLGAAVAGIFYECGLGMSKPDYSMAYKYYEESNEMGEPLGKCLLATMPLRAPPGLIPGDYKGWKRIKKETAGRFQGGSSDALKWLVNAAEHYLLGEAMYMLGSCYEAGVGVGPIDQYAAVEWYKKACQTGTPGARRIMSRCYMQGIGVEKNSEAAKYWLIRAIKDSGDPEAMAQMSEYYEQGLFPADENDLEDFANPREPKIKNLPRPSEPFTSVDATMNITDMFEPEVIERIQLANEPRHLSRDLREAFYWADLSYQKGCAQGTFRLAHCYEFGIGTSFDIDKAIELYNSASNMGYSPAQFSLACCYSAANGVDKDDEKAVALTKEAAESGYLPAMLSIAEYYSLGLVPEEESDYDDEASEKEKKKGKDKDEEDSEEENKTMAMKWWRRAAKRGSRQAQYQLAGCFRDGIGCEIDSTKALYWMRKSAEAGLPEAQLELGVLLVETAPLSDSNSSTRTGSTGKSSTNSGNSDKRLALQQRDNEAFYWILRSAKNGYPEAQMELAQLFIEGTFVRRNASTAFYWFKRAAKSGHPYGQYRVGAMLLDGEGVGQANLREAVKWLKLACEQGWSDAEKLLPTALGMANEESQFKTGITKPGAAPISFVY